MSKLKERFLHGLLAVRDAFSRFPLTTLFLLFGTGLVWSMIQLHGEPPLITEKLVFTSAIGAIVSAVAQGAWEYQPKRSRYFFYGGALIFTLVYFLLIRSATEVTMEVSVRTAVAFFALLCIFIWTPSFQGRRNFNPIFLTHFKSVFTSVLFAGVLSAGLSAIIAAIDVLLFKIDTDLYGYVNSFIWIFFMPIFYLSILPRFSSDEEPDIAHALRVSNYPKFLDVLVSRVGIPLITGFTAVLFFYFIKIVITLNWPIGQLGPIVLGYSTAGIFLYVMAGLLENNFVLFYRKWFPKALVGVVLMQLVSVGIRINAYGITESRYYVALFGIYSLIIGLILSFKSIGKNGLIVMLVAGFAILSVVPPIDSFTLSRVSQISRLEAILVHEGMLTDGKFTPKADPSENAKIEITNILSYLDSRGYVKNVAWLPEKFNAYTDMEAVIGFAPYYKVEGDSRTKNIYIGLNDMHPMDINGYDVMVPRFADPISGNASLTLDFTVRGAKYKLEVNRVDNFDAEVVIKDSSGQIVVSDKLLVHAKSLTGLTFDEKNTLPPDAMSFMKEENGASMKIIFQNINMNEETANYSFYVLFKAAK